MKGIDFDYNTSRERLILPEYGRNIQKLVRHLSTIESIEERNRYAQALIQVMGNLNPHLRDINDFKHKLWDHLAIISDFNLDIDSPYPTPTRETISEKPKTVAYGSTDLRFKHYGKNIEYLVDKACKMEEGQDKQDFILMVANVMKRFYLIWNKEAVVDEIIFKDLELISKGRIKLGNEVKLEETRDILYRAQRKNNNPPTNNNSNSNYRNYGNNSGGNHSHNYHGNSNGNKKRY